jgi:hypothetical protein
MQLCLGKDSSIPHQLQPEGCFVGFFQHNTEFGDEFRTPAGTTSGTVVGPN